MVWRFECLGEGGEMLGSILPSDTIQHYTFRMDHTISAAYEEMNQKQQQYFLPYIFRFP
jgi:hypothetical protein